MEKELEYCQICPNKCKVNRIKGELGRCKSGNNVKIALVSTYNFEEPCISGKNGSGTIFFSNCNLNCVFCQNYEISQDGFGKEVSIQELVEIFLNQQEKNVENINLVTPTSYVFQIIEAIKIAKREGLKIPIVYNTNGYESIDTLKELNGLIDIYLPDFKYVENVIAKRYSKIENYFEVTSKALIEMYKQVGNVEFDERGIMKKGMIIRHLILPNNIDNTFKVLRWIDSNFSKNVLISVMAQYFPTYKANEFNELNRKISKEEYKKVENFLYDLNIENGYIQELSENEEEYVPKWNLNEF